VKASGLIEHYRREKASAAKRAPRTSMNW